MTTPKVKAGGHAGLPPQDANTEILLAYQKRLLETVAANAVTVCEKSRRIGVTWGIAAQAVLMAGAELTAGGMDVMYIGYNLDMAREFIATCGQWAKAFGKAAGEVGEFLFTEGDQSIQAFRVNMASGFEVVALASRPRSLRGRQGFVIVDEAAFHDDLKELMKAALAFLIWGGKVLVISTHDGAANYFAELVDNCRKGRERYALLRITFDDAVEDGLYDRVKLKLEARGQKVPSREEWVADIRAFYGDAADEELDVNPKQGTGVYLPTWMIERAMSEGIPVVRWHQPDSFAQLADHLREAEARDFCERELRPLLEAMDPKLQSAFGHDFARKGDLSVFWPLQLLQDMRRRPPFVLELRNIPFEQQRQILFYAVDRLPNFIGGALDATGNGAYLAEVAAQRYGFERIAQVHLTEAWYRDAMPKFKAGFEDQTTILPKDADVLADHRIIRLVRGVPVIPRASEGGGKGEDKKQDAKRHGDSAIAHVLADFAIRMDTPDMEGFATGADQRAALVLDFDAINDAYARMGDSPDDTPGNWEGFD